MKEFSDAIEGNGLALNHYNPSKPGRIAPFCNLPRHASREGRGATHVVGLTANARPEEVQRDDGMNNCLFKPVTRSLLERYLRQAERTQQASSPCFDISKISDITAGDAAMPHQLLASL